MALSMKLVLSLLCVLLLYDQQLCSLSLETGEPEQEKDDREWTSPLPIVGGGQGKTAIIRNSPRFVVRLPDKNLLCFFVEGFELFTYNLITSNYIVLNGFLNTTTLPLNDMDDDDVIDPAPLIRGFTDIGIIIKSVEGRSRGGTRVFRHSVYGSKQKVVLEKFGEVDMRHGAISFFLIEGHSNIESENSKHEQFRVVMDKPKCDILVVSGVRGLFSVYVEDLSGLVGINTHGLIGQFLNSTVRIDSAQSKLIRRSGDPVNVEKGSIWDSLRDEVYPPDQQCWYPMEGERVIEGELWEYVVEHLHAKKSKHNLFNVV